MSLRDFEDPKAFKSQRAECEIKELFQPANLSSRLVRESLWLMLTHSLLAIALLGLADCIN